MPMKKALVGAVMLLAMATGSTNAAQIEWTLNNGAFDDNGTVAGSFVWDNTLNSVTFWNFSVSGGDAATFPATTYSTATSSFLGSYFDVNVGTDTLIFQIAGNSRELRFSFVDLALSVVGLALVPLSNGYTGPTGYAECISCLPYRTGELGASFSGTEVVPVPAALPLLASGLGALGFIGWRRKRQAAAAA